MSDLKKDSSDKLEPLSKYLYLVMAQISSVI